MRSLSTEEFVKCIVHIYWDHISFLAPLGQIDASKLPVAVQWSHSRCGASFRTIFASTRTESSNPDPNQDALSTLLQLASPRPLGSSRTLTTSLSATLLTRSCSAFK